MNLRFKPASPRIDDVLDTKHVSKLWQQVGSDYISALEHVTGLAFHHRAAVVCCGRLPVSKSGTIDHKAIWLASRTAQKDGSLRRSDVDLLAALTHELCHRLLAEHHILLPISTSELVYKDHRLLYVFLYDSWVAAFGKSHAQQLAKSESAITVRAYHRAWAWAMRLSAKKRATLTSKLARRSELGLTKAFSPEGAVEHLQPLASPEVGGGPPPGAQMEAAPQEAQLAQQALKYVETAQPDWNLEPSEVEVTQPENQDQMLQALDSMAQEEGGDLLARRQDANVAAARRSSENPNGGFTRLNLEAGFNLHDHIEPGMDRQAYYQLRNESDPTVEYVDTPDEHNLLFTGMLEATGAQPLRDDLAEGNETGSRIYKGMIDGKPVYFEEHVGPVTITEDGETKNKYARSVIVLSEASARTALNELSENEQAAMEELGYEQPIIGDPNYDQAIKPTRSNMRELVEQKAPDVPDTTEQPSAPTEQAEAEQPALATTEAPTEKDLRESFHGVKESTEFDRGMQAKMAEKARPEQVAESKAVLEQHGINADLIDPAAAP